MAWTHTARFLTTASKLDQLPVTELPEIAFVGRSNAGKSTAINRLAQQKRRITRPALHAVTRIDR